MTVNTTAITANETARKKARDTYRQTVTSRLKFSFFLIMKMPIGFLAGIRLLQLDDRQCKTSVPYKWLSQNPFKSIYFATQAMAAELSTGALSMLTIQGINPPVSMLVTGMEAIYTKKASDTVYFTCEEGEKIFEIVEECLQSGEGREVKVATVGRLKDGTEVSRFHFTWSFKQRSKK